MSAKWKEIARLRFRGKRFADHALDASALSEVQKFLRLVEETAKALWRAEHPDRERLPTGFEQQNRALLREVAAGSAVAVIGARVGDARQAEFLDRRAEPLLMAADLTQRAFQSIATNRSLPDSVPKTLVPEFADFGKTLGQDEFLEIKAATRKTAVRYRPAFRQRWSEFAPRPYQAKLTQVGEIVEADVRNGRFQIWTDRDIALPAPFIPEQETLITAALKDHRSMRVRIAGRAEFSAEGKPLRFLEITDLSPVPAEALLFDPNAPSIEEELEAIWSEVPDSAWADVPDDLSQNLDHYLYGTPKR